MNVECVRQLSDADKMPEVDTSEEERSMLSHSFRGFDPWSVGALVWGPRVMQEKV